VIRLSVEETKVVWMVLGVLSLMATHCWPKVTRLSITSKSVKICFLIVK
jgi:hypothetical protein